MTVGEQNYKASLQVINKDELILELVSIVDEFNRESSAVFDDRSLTLQVPRLGYFVFPDDYLHFDVELELIPGTEPLQFRVTTAEPVMQ